MCVCVARQSVWVHRKPIETPAGYDCQPLIKQEKNISGLRHIWPPWKGQCGFFLFIFFGRTVFFSVLIHFLFLLNTCHFYHPVNEPTKIKHIKKAVVHSDRFYYKKNVGSRRKNRLKTKKAPVQTGNSCLSDWPTATTSGLKHFTIYHARRAAGNTCGKEITKGEHITSAQHRKTSAIGRKRPRQITRTSHVVERVRVHIPSRQEQEQGRVCFSFEQVVWHLREVQRHSRISDWLISQCLRYLRYCKQSTL